MQLVKDIGMPYSKEQLNYFRMVHIVVTIFSRALRELFKKEWHRLYGSKWRDRRRDGQRFSSKESPLDRRRNRRALKTIRKGDSSQFDPSVLCYCMLHSDSVGANLKNRDPRRYNEICRLQVLRNKVCHMAAKDAEVKDGEFQSFCSEAIACFRNLRLSTRDLKKIAEEKSFDTDEVVRLRTELTREQLAVGEYEQYFSRKSSTYAPEKIHRATVKYPKHYKRVMRTFTDAIYKLDWEEFKRQSQIFLSNVQEWTTKLFVQIELAYGYNIQGESEEAMRLLNDTIKNAWKAGENSSRIFSRALTRKSLKRMYEQKHSESRALAEEASSAVSTIESPEEEIISQIRIVECLLNEDGSLESKKEKFTPVWNSVIEMCERNLDSIPRGPFYLKFVFAYKALLHLGFSKNGFDPCPSSVSDLDVAQRCVQRLEEPDLKTEFEDNYADAFRLICKSKIVFDKTKVADVAEEVETWQKEALSLYDKAAAACRSAKNDGILFKLSSLKEYLKNGQQSGN